MPINECPRGKLESILKERKQEEMKKYFKTCSEPGIAGSDLK